MERVFEVVHYAELGRASRLTVTPTRITLKISPEDAQREQELTELSHSIASQASYPLALRGIFRWEHAVIVLATKNKSAKHRVSFRFSLPGGTLLEATNTGQYAI